jgi:hypothetical protein
MQQYGQPGAACSAIWRRATPINPVETIVEPLPFNTLWQYVMYILVNAD